MNVLTSWNEVPLFESEAVEAVYWQDTRLDFRLMESATVPSAELSESVTISLRMDPRLLSRLKRLARSRYLNYQSMIKQWISERLEQEARGR
jgi:predicted DNA binding CopG/RHH family protein